MLLARVDPRHLGGEGVAGTPGACSQTFCHPNSCIVMVHRQRFSMYTRSAPPPPDVEAQGCTHACCGDLFCFFSSGCHERPRWSRRKAAGATTACSVASPAAVDRDGTGYGSSPLRASPTSGTSAGRPGIPSEPAPQGGLVAPPSPRSGDVPSLSIPVLACRASEAVDSSTLSYLLAQSLTELEERRRRRRC